jgi:hypothetical protein
MSKINFIDDELWARVEADRFQEERTREPHFVTFRATQEEINIREAEDAQEGAIGQNELQQFGEKLARLARERVRFERYLVRQGFFPGLAADDPLGVAR